MEDNNDTAEHDAKPPPLSPSGDIDKKKEKQQHQRSSSLVLSMVLVLLFYA